MSNQKIVVIQKYIYYRIHVITLLFLCLETLTELFLSDLLRHGKTLKTFEQHPLSMLNDLTSGNALSRRHRLAYWIFEDHLKRLYVQFINAIDVVGKDTIESNREKAVTAMHKLLSGNMEQSTVSLNMKCNELSLLKVF